MVMQEEPESRARPVAPTPGAAAIVTAFVETMHRASEDPRICGTLARAETSIAFEVRDLPGRRVVLRLEGDHIDIADDSSAPAEATLELDSIDIHELLLGGVPLPMKIAAGKVGFRGPVRRFMRVIAPIGQLAGDYREEVEAALDRREEGRAS